MEAPQHPVGPAPAETPADAAGRAPLIAQIEGAPAEMRRALAGLTETQLDVKYRNWTVRQIANHLADSHVNSFVRFRWALTEETPLIKAYAEDLWSDLPNAKAGDLEPTLRLLEGLHGRWARLLRAMDDAQFARAFRHPDGRLIPLSRALVIYAWHGRHHTGQVLWMRRQHGWG